MEIINVSGSRKRATARVTLRRGSGHIFINGKSPEEYFKKAHLIQWALQPLEETGLRDVVDVKVRVEGGGVSGQAGAVRHALARAIVKLDPSKRPILRKAGMLTRDPREKERMKYGRTKRRRAWQYTKR
ncbi:MAG: 30S ribosomal protein S9 [Thermotogae bacterium]|nr:30S ribosomal protein S9 [Thermotogota bacterium]